MTKICPFIGKPCIREECEGFIMIYDGLKRTGVFKRATIIRAPYCLALRKELDIQSSEPKKSEDLNTEKKLI